MVIAIMSDSHDNIWNVGKAVEIIKSRQAQVIIHCGDLVAPFILKELAKFEGPVHWVLGNNDGDQYLLTKLCLTELKNMEPHGFIGKLNFEEVAIAFTHYEEVGYALAHTGQYHLVCCGHTHAYRLQKIHQTTLLNPGEVMGKDGPGTFCLFDTVTKEVKLLKLV
ncbi:MAG TPA: metallophosphoesterase [Syntrophaceae bacterium]|nr:metallophosphoesterase [Syntrophaceae bacterium]